MKQNLLSNKLLPKRLIERTLSQLDKLGFTLAKHGVSDKLNRHTLIANAVVQKNRLAAELDRMQLHYQLRMNKLSKIGKNMDAQMGKNLEKLPNPLAKPAQRIRRKLNKAGRS